MLTVVLGHAAFKGVFHLQYERGGGVQTGRQVICQDVEEEARYF